MRPVALLAVLAACAEGAPDPTDPLATDQAGVPFLMQPDLHVGNLVLGETLLAQVDDVLPGAIVYLAAGPRMGVGPCYWGVCLGVEQPRLLGTTKADASGVANLSLPVSPSFPWDGAALQAITSMPGQPATQVLWRKAQPDAPPEVEINPVLPGVFMPHEPNDIWINGDTVWMEVSYGGGCAPHDFVLSWDGLYLESFPIQVSLQLHHNPNGDMCDAWITERLRFDLVPLRTGWGYGEPDLMTVHIGRETDDYLF